MLDSRKVWQIAVRIRDYLGNWHGSVLILSQQMQLYYAETRSACIIRILGNQIIITFLILEKVTKENKNLGHKHLLTLSKIFINVTIQGRCRPVCYAVC